MKEVGATASVGFVSNEMRLALKHGDVTLEKKTGLAYGCASMSKTAEDASTRARGIGPVRSARSSIVTNQQQWTSTLIVFPEGTIVMENITPPNPHSSQASHLRARNKTSDRQ
jgi:hypothetical protein